MKPEWYCKLFIRAEMPEEELLQATRDTRFVFAAITDRTGFKHRLFNLLEQGRPHVITSHIVPLTEGNEVDYANVQESPWGGEGRTESFFALYEQAVQLARRLIQDFPSCDLAAITGEKPFG